MREPEEVLRAFNAKMEALREETQRQVDVAVEEFKKELGGVPGLTAYTPPMLTLTPAKLYTAKT